MSAVLGAHDRISSEMLVKWQGREIARSDGFFLLYEWVHDGVAYAHDYHRSLASLTPRNSARAELHIGLVHSRKIRRAKSASVPRRLISSMVSPSKFFALK
jgi:hypothetical protein